MSRCVNANKVAMGNILYYCDMKLVYGLCSVLMQKPLGWLNVAWRLLKYKLNKDTDQLDLHKIT